MKGDWKRMKNKFFILAPVVAIVVMFIFILTLFPSVQPTPKNLPVAIVNEDVGVTIPQQGEVNLGNTLVKTIQQATANAEDEPAIKWIVVDSKAALEKGLQNKDYYAALYVPEDFSAKQASLRSPNPTNPELEILINQGMNATVANVTTQALSGIVDNMNNMMRKQILDTFAAQNMTLTAEQAAAIATPITKVVTIVHGAGENMGGGNMPVNLFQPLWIGSIATSLLLFFAVQKSQAKTKKSALLQRFIQIGIGFIAACFIGFGLPFLADQMVGFHIPDYSETALFLTITAAAFIMMIVAVLSYIGLAGIVVFILLLFFSAPLLALAPEMMSSFYRDYVYSWLPMRFMIDGLKDIFFFGTGVTWENTKVFVWIFIVGSILIIASAFMPKKEAGGSEKENKEEMISDSL